jgi:hypothetical protein
MAGQSSQSRFLPDTPPTMYQPSHPLQKPLPTMYDLPSEEVGDSGLPGAAGAGLPALV